MNSYVAYGLAIQSALPLPELVPAGGPADVVIRLGRVCRWPTLAPNTGAGFWAAGDEACHALDGVGAFLVRGGREMVVDPAPGVEDRVLRLSILGPALALLLHQRGFYVVHASAVQIDGSAVAFAGARGWGKSALAAALHRRGHGVVADDLTAINGVGDCPMVYPGFPQLKLWPAALASLGESPEALPRLHPLFEKRARDVNGFCETPVPLKGIYVLAGARAQGNEIESLRPQEAFFELLPNWYGTRFGEALLQVEGAAPSHFLRCANLARKVPIRRLRARDLLSTLSETARLVEDDLALQR